MEGWRSVRGLPREVWVLAAATLVNRMGTMALPFLVLYLTKSVGLSASGAAALLAVYGATALIASPLGGRLSDRIGPTRVLLVSLFGTGALLLVYPLARSFGSVALLTAAWSMVNELFRPAVLSAVTAVVGPEKRRTAIALNRIAVNLGMSVGPALGGFLASVSFPLLFAVDGFTSLVAGAILLLFPSAPRRAQTLHHERAAGFDPSFVAFILAVVPIGIVFFQHGSTMALYLVDHLRFSERTYGLLFTLNTLIIVAIEVPLNAATARWRHARSLALGSLLVGLGFGGLAVARTLPEVVLTVVVWTFGEMVLLPAMGSFVAEIAPPGKRGAYLGVYTMSFSFCYAVAPWLGTTLLEKQGAPALWIGTFLASLISAAAFLPLREPVRAGTLGQVRSTSG